MLRLCNIASCYDVRGGRVDMVQGEMLFVSLLLGVPTSTTQLLTLSVMTSI